MASKPLSEIATPAAITYARDRATHYELRNPMLALIYRVVAEVLQHEQEDAVVDKVRITNEELAAGLAELDANAS